jgi:hypothetical protein
MNSTISYFGDNTMADAELKKLVDIVFESCDTDKDGDLNYVGKYQLLYLVFCFLLFIVHRIYESRV